VASRLGGLPELVADGETGYLVEPGDVAALRARLALVLDDPAAADGMGQAARACAVERFTWDMCARRCLGCVGEGRVEHVEVAHHAPPVQPFTLDDDLDAVVVSVTLALGSLDAGHRMEGPHLYRRANQVHIASRSTRQRGLARPPPGRGRRTRPPRPPAGRCG